jgi:hypothetical protein
MYWSTALLLNFIVPTKAFKLEVTRQNISQKHHDNNVVNDYFYPFANLVVRTPKAHASFYCSSYLKLKSIAIGLKLSSRSTPK